MVVINVVLSLSLFPVYGHVAIAVATSVSAWVNLFLLALTQWRRGDFKPDRQTLKRLQLLLLSSVLMGAAILGLRLVLVDLLSAGFMEQLLAVTIMIGGGAGIYFAIALATGAIDRTRLNRLLRRQA